LAQHNADLYILFQDYLPSLTLAVYLQHKPIVELIIRLGIDPNSADTRHGRSALHYAAYFHATTDIFHLLLSSTAHHIIDINARDKYGLSVLDYARANVHGSAAIADLLLQLNVYDPHRGEIFDVDTQIETPTMTIFASPVELASLKTKTSDDNRSNRTKDKNKHRDEPKAIEQLAD
jgi:ankyrin repeat protein